MSAPITIRLVGPRQRENACKIVNSVPDGYVVKVGQETRNDAQNRKLHALIKDLREQSEEHGRFSVEETKLRFMNALGKEMRFLPELEGSGLFPVAQKTSLLSKAQFSLLVDLIYLHGDRLGVQWTEPRDAP